MSNPVLVVAHPGHELMVLGWVAENLPSVSILTDGSGRTGSSRLASSARVLKDSGATAGPLWGVMTDAAFYQAILAGKADVFTGLARTLAEYLLTVRPPYVAGDAREGMNPIHDICRMIIDAAVRQVRRCGAILENYSFFLYAPHSAAPAGRAIRKTLSDEDSTLR